MTATFQPKGYGFHEKGEKEISIDLKSTLERVLQNHMVLTQGDIVPVRHNGKTYHLAVKKLEPDSAVCIRDTEIQVELLPSEVAEQEIEQKQKIELLKKQAKLNEEKLRKQRKDNLLKLKSMIPNQQQQQQQQKQSVNIQVRFGGNSAVSSSSSASQSSNKIQSSFSKSASIKDLFDWVALSLIDVEPPIGSLEKQLELGLDYEFQLVYVISPGNRLTLKPIDNYISQTLESSGIKISSSLFLEYIDGRTEPLINVNNSDTMDIEDPKLPGFGTSNWKKAFDDAEKLTDNDINVYASSSTTNISSMDENDSTNFLSEQEKNRLLNDLRERNVTPFNALSVIQKYPKQLIELEKMGFFPDSRIIDMLMKYQGRIERVINILSEEQIKKQSLPISQHEQEFSNNVKTEQDIGTKMDIVDDLSQIDEYKNQLETLHGIGLVDDVRNIMLLKKYNKDLEKVINILLS